MDLFEFSIKIDRSCFNILKSIKQFVHQKYNEYTRIRLIRSRHSAEVVLHVFIQHAQVILHHIRICQ